MTLIEETFDTVARPMTAGLLVTIISLLTDEARLDPSDFVGVEDWPEGQRTRFIEQVAQNFDGIIEWANRGKAALPT